MFSLSDRGPADVYIDTNDIVSKCTNEMLASAVGDMILMHSKERQRKGETKEEKKTEREREREHRERGFILLVNCPFFLLSLSLSLSLCTYAVSLSLSLSSAGTVHEKILSRPASSRKNQKIDVISQT